MASQRSINGTYNLQRNLSGGGIMSKVMLGENNLSDVKSATISRSNLGLVGHIAAGSYLQLTNNYSGLTNETISAFASSNSTPSTLCAYGNDGVLNGNVIKSISIFTNAISTSSLTSTTPSILFSNKYLANINYVACNKYVDYYNHTLMQSDGNGNNTIYANLITSPNTSISLNSKNLTNVGSVTSGSYISCGTMYSYYIDNPLNNTGYGSGATQTIGFNQNNVNNINTLNCSTINCSSITSTSGNIDLNSANITNVNTLTCSSLNSPTSEINCRAKNLVNIGQVQLRPFSTLYVTYFDCSVNYNIVGAVPYTMYFNNNALSSIGNITCSDISCGNIVSTGIISGNGSSLTNLNATSITGTISSSIIPQLPYAQWRILYETSALATSTTTLTLTFATTINVNLANTTTFRYEIPFFYNSTTDRTAKVNFAYNGNGMAGSTYIYFSIHAFSANTMALTSGTTPINRVLCVVASGTNYGFNETLLDLTTLGLTNTACYFLCLSDINATNTGSYKLASITFSIGSI